MLAGRETVSYIVLLFAVLFSGCKTPPLPPPDTVGVSEDFQIAPAAPLSQPIAPEIGPVSKWPQQWVNTWIPLESWSRYNGLAWISRVADSSSRAYEMQSPAGPIAIRVGTRIAHCDGLEYWLGFAPRLIQGVPHIHSLDAQKNLQTLLIPPAGGFARNGTVVIDPGHGGADGGSQSVFNQQFEKSYTLDWALRLKNLLTQNGWNVVLTRSHDVDLSLQQRVTIAEQAKADLFLSLHFNSGLPNRQLAGIETYCLTPAGMPSSLVRSYDDDLTQVFPNNAFDEQNLQVALRLHRNIVRTTGAPDRGVRRARFMGVLRGQNRPAVLIEGGYLSNLAEARNIAAPHYRQQLAEAVAGAFY